MIIMLLHAQLHEESTINRGHEFGEKLGHESNIEIKVLHNYFMILWNYVVFFIVLGYKQNTIIDILLVKVLSVFLIVANIKSCFAWNKLQSYLLRL